MNEKTKLIRNKKRNARLYPIYKMCSWDLLFYYAISFVFLTQTKGMDVAQVMLTDAIYPVFKIAFQIPGAAIIDNLGKRKSLMIANVFLSITLVILIFSTGIATVLVAYAVMAFSFAIKGVAEPNLLYDSVTQKKGRGMFAKIEEKGARNYYYLDGISSLLTGFLFVINGYIPMVVSLGFTVIAVALSSCFKDIYIKPVDKEKTMRKRIIEYKEELKIASKFIFKSRRLQAIMVFVMIFNGLIYISYTLREGLLTEVGVLPQYFAVIISVLTVISGIGSSFEMKIHNKLRNKALSVLSMLYITTFIGIGCVTIFNIPFPIVMGVMLILYAIQYCVQGPYHVLLEKYLKSFATPDMRVKIQTTFSLIKSISEMAMAFLASMLLAKIDASQSFLVIGVLFFFILIAILKWMKPRFGLNPEEYRKEDIKFNEVVK